MSQTSWVIFSLIMAGFTAHAGYVIGRIRESNRWWLEVEELRKTTARQAALLRMMPKDEVKP